MHRTLSAICLSIVTSLFVPVNARADTVDVISITGPDLSISYFSPSSFEVEREPSMTVIGGPLVNATINGDSNYLLRPLYGLGSELSAYIVASSTASPSAYNNAFYGPQLVQLIGEGPVDDTFNLVPGTYGVAASAGAPDVYTLTIASEGTAVAPEPTSLTLLATGAVGLVSTRLRRRRI